MSARSPVALVMLAILLLGAAVLRAGPKDHPGAIAPGEAHRPLAALAGRWQAVARFAAGPNQPATEVRGEMQARTMVGGLYLQQELTLDLGSSRLEGLGHWGYDQARGEYVSYWADNQGTQWIRANGTWHADRRCFEERGESDDPATGGKRRFHYLTSLVGNDEYVLQMYDVGDDGHEQVVGAITFTRKRE